MITKIAVAAGIPMVISKQPHGANLSAEPDLGARLQAANQDAKRLVIVEMPGPEVEAALRTSGYELIIIDHHRYTDLDRMRHESSLEQFLAIFNIDDDRLTSLGFDPVLVRGVGLLDRGFVWELAKEGVPKEDAARIRAFYLSLADELNGPREVERAEALRAWNERTERDGVIIVTSGREDLALREALSFIVAEHYEAAPELLFVQGKRRLTVQDSDAAPALFARFGGFTFGQDRCWGVQSTKEQPLPNIDDVLAVIVSAR